MMFGLRGYEGSNPKDGAPFSWGSTPKDWKSIFSVNSTIKKQWPQLCVYFLRGQSRMLVPSSTGAPNPDICGTNSSWGFNFNLRPEQWKVQLEPLTNHGDTQLGKGKPNPEWTDHWTLDPTTTRNAHMHDNTHSG